MNIATHLERAARAYPQRAAIAAGSRVWADYRELGSRVQRLAGALCQRLALRPGDRVALLMDNAPEYLEVLYACWHAGLVAVPGNARLHAREHAYLVEHSGARVVFASAAQGTALASAGTGGPGGAPAVIEPGSAEYLSLLGAAPVPVRPRAPDDTAWLFYTSGTTGRPKGAMLSHRNLLAMCLGYFADVDPGAPWRAILHAAPMSHGSGLYALPHIAQAACHVIPESGGFEPAEIGALARRWPGLVLFAAPTMVRRLVAHDDAPAPADLKLIIYGGGPMYLEDCLAALERFGARLSQLYGQGESPMTITALNAGFHADGAHPRYRERLASVGLAQTPVAVQVVDGDGRSLPAGSVGEVRVRGDTVMQGYWRDRQASADTLRDGWLHTGNLGAFDEDGFLTLKDRSKDLIISGGSNIYPREVEEALLAHPGIAEAAVIGRDDREWGERVIAWLVVTPDAPVPRPEDLDAWCLQRLARYKRPREYRFTDALPKNNYGKVLKTALRRMDRGDGG